MNDYLYLVKFGTKEHLKQLADGYMFFNVVENYREDKSDYRGDINEGKIPVNPQKIELIMQNGGNLFDIVSRPDKVMRSVVGDEKTLLFCASKLDEKVFHKINDTNRRNLCDEFRHEVHKFGDYVLLITANELIYRMQKQVDHKFTGFLRGSVEYRDLKDFSEEQDFRKIYFPYDNFYDPFFVKDIKYEWQNEWRMILQDDKNQISKPCGTGVIVNIGKLDYALFYDTENFLNGISMTDR